MKTMSFHQRIPHAKEFVKFIEKKAVPIHLLPDSWFVKSFGFQNIFFTFTTNWFVIYGKISPITIKESSNNCDFVLANN